MMMMIMDDEWCIHSSLGFCLQQRFFRKAHGGKTSPARVALAPDPSGEMANKSPLGALATGWWFGTDFFYFLEG